MKNEELDALARNRSLANELEQIRVELSEKVKSRKLVADEIETLRNELSIVNAKLSHARHLEEATQRLSCIHDQIQKQLPSKSPLLAPSGGVEGRASSIPDLGNVTREYCLDLQSVT